jgi:hypothetical protein
MKRAMTSILHTRPVKSNKAECEANFTGQGNDFYSEFHVIFKNKI